MSTKKKPQSSSGQKPGFSEFIAFARTKTFWTHIALIFGFFLVCLILSLTWLKSYTRHGQELEMPDYTGYFLKSAVKDASERSFEIRVTDSIHVVGKPGGEILQQSPPAFSTVKERRTIYVTVTKENPDQVPLNRLPDLYGKDFQRKKNELLNAFQIQSRVVGKKFDPGQEDQILMVIYEGDTLVDAYRNKDETMIEKGGTLEFIISEQKGGSMPVPDLVCKTLAESRFLLDNLGLVLGEILFEGPVGDQEEAYISGQSPSAEDGNITMGEVINLTISENKPLFCEE